MHIQWDKSLSVGVKTIDEQHQELFRLVNQLLESLVQARGKEEVAKVLAFLKDYVIQHFGAEQKLMTQYKYPALLSHRTQHDEFVKTFMQVHGEFEKSGPTVALAMKLNSYLGSWLRDHIGTTDRALGKFLLANHSAGATL
jgi:hemerythrin